MKVLVEHAGIRMPAESDVQSWIDPALANRDRLTALPSVAAPSSLPRRVVRRLLRFLRD
jgi:hypothetical protein